MVVEEQIRELKKRFRLAMNGVVSTDMRRRGVDYGLNFGVALPTIRKIVGSFAQELSLADALWRDSVRECRIAATMLAPGDLFTRERLDQWIALPLTVELAEQLSHNLLTRVPFAFSWACEQVNSPRQEVRRAAFLALGRISSPEPLSAVLRKTILHAGVDSIAHSLIMINPVLSAWEKQLTSEPDFLFELEDACRDREMEKSLVDYLLTLY